MCFVLQKFFLFLKRHKYKQENNQIKKLINKILFEKEYHLEQAQKGQDLLKLKMEVQYILCFDEILYLLLKP